MNSKLFFSCRLSFSLAGCISLAPQLTHAGELTRISGTYEVMGKTDSGHSTVVRMRIHVTNQGTRKLSVEHIALRDFSHPSRQQVRACALTLAAGSAADLTQEFTVPGIDYESWQRGTHPKLILEIVTDPGLRTTEVLPLSRVSDRKGN